MDIAKSKSIWDRGPGKVGIPLLTLFLGAAISYGVQTWNGRLRSIEYYVASSSSLIEQPDLGGKNLRVTIDEKEIDNLSTVSVYLVNRSGRDFDNLPVEIYLSHEDGSPVDLIRESVVPTRFINQIQSATMPSKTIVRNYLLDVANRSSNNKALLRVDFVVVGKAAPNVIVYVAKTGVEAKRKDVLDKSEKFSFSTAFIFVMIGFMAATMFLATVFTLMAILPRKSEHTESE